MDADQHFPVFVGLPVPLELVESLQECAKTLGGAFERDDVNVNFSSPASYHLTLRYLGPVYSPTVSSIVDAITPVVKGEPLSSLHLHGVGAFPDMSNAKVFWAGVKHQEMLQELAGKVSQALEPLGFEPEDRPFSAHVTLGRLPSPTDTSSVLGPWQTKDFGRGNLDSIVLYKGRAKPGHEHERLASWPLRS